MRKKLPISWISPLLLSPLLLACPQEKKAAEHSGPQVVKTEDPPEGAAAQPGSKPANPHDSFDKGPPGEPISGLVKLGEGLSADDVKPTDVLFIMARESQGGGKFGRLVGVQRHGKLEFPKRYELSEKDVMVPGIPFKGPFIMMARLDRDGDPMTRKPEDLYAVVKEEVHSGSEDVHMILTKGNVKETEPPPGAKPPPKKAATQPKARMKTTPLKAKVKTAPNPKRKLRLKQPATQPK